MSAKTSHLKNVGETYHQFELHKITPIAELQCILREVVHLPTGAHIMHIENDDTENLFCLAFRTVPYNSNGVAHILEHTVLCGSKKFPVKDPFFAMNRRSLNTFMNALTGSDFTCYPAASEVKQDFYNLLEVYLDAVFEPNLNELSFWQEGHRLEFTNLNDPSSPLQYKGIVYNEMKGALSSGNARLAEAFNATLFPNITYGYNSGGDPQVIPQLTYEELKKFHQNFYHPSQCLFFFYGNMPLEKHLDFIAQHTLDHVQPMPPLAKIALQPRFKSPVFRQFTYPIAKDESSVNKTLIALGWLTCHILEQETALALCIVMIILMDTDASPLKMALLQSGLCKQASGFIDIDLQEIPCGLVLKGCEAEQVKTLSEIVKNTLQNLVEAGIALPLIDNAMHQLEFHRSEITGDHSPFGLSLFMRSGLLKQHGADPEEGLKIHSLFERLRQDILATPNYLGKIIKGYFLDNNHFITIVMTPDQNLAESEASAEKQILQEIKESLSEAQIKNIVERAVALEAFQKKQELEDIDILPKVTLSDVPLNVKEYPIVHQQCGKLQVFHHHAFTNEIVYADLVFALPHIPEEDLIYLRLLTVILTQIGAGQRNYQENLEYIQGNTGGIGASISLNVQAKDFQHCRPTFHIKGKALHHKAEQLFTLLYDIAVKPQLQDVKRIKEIISKHFSGLESQFNQSALKYAINLSSKGLNIPSHLAEKLYGLSYYQQLRTIVRQIDKEEAKKETKQETHLIQKLKSMCQHVLCLAHPHLIITCHRSKYEELKNNQFYGLHNIPTTEAHSWHGKYPLEPTLAHARHIASPVAFIGQVCCTTSYIDPQAPLLSLAARLLDNLTLHATIREQGGAYGAGAVHHPTSGTFYFYSYRDPNIASTLAAFRESIENILQGNFDADDLESAKLEIIQDLDAPISPGSRAEAAYAWYLEGKTTQIRQTYRTALLAASTEQVIEAAKSILWPAIQKGVPVIFAGEDLLANYNNLQDQKAQTLLPIEPI